MLETCRGSILGHLIDNRTDLDDLTEAAPEKAQRFRALQNEINTVINPSGDTNSRVKQTRRRIEAEGELRACLEEIRTLEGFQRFLLGPTESELNQCCCCSRTHPHRQYFIDRSDAIIVIKDASVLLPLPELNYEKVKEYLDADVTKFCFKDIGRKNKKFRELQKWLCDNCVKLIFKRLDDMASGLAKFRVWWIGIGIASSLPFHAAGIYTGNFRDTALSRAISSYTPTLKVLIYGQQKLKNNWPKLDVQPLTIKQETKPRLAVIIMPSTPGRTDLEGVQRDAEEVEKIVRDTYSPKIILRPSTKDTMVTIAECEVVHFACHGESNVTDPSSSHLLLQTTTPDSAMALPIIDELNLRDVAVADLSHGKLAFLSACSTAQNTRNLGDEILHLAAGFQVAGYLHAIGNLWPSDDEVSVRLVREFYQHLVLSGELGNGDNVAKALNGALTDVAKRYAKQPLCWAQFVHFGV